jgi:MFS family permease
MLPSAAIHRSGWQDLFVARELDYVPYGVDRYFMLVVKALAALMGGLAIALGPVAPLILVSQQLTPPEYGRIVGGVGIAGVVVGLTAGQLGDRFSRVRVLLWGMMPALAFHFLLAFMPNGQPGLFAFLYVGLGLTEAWAIVTVSALLRDFSPRRVIYSIITQVWVFIAPSLLADHGWRLVWTICGLGALVAAPVIALCRGSWGPFPTRKPAPAQVPEISRPALA